MILRGLLGFGDPARVLPRPGLVIAVGVLAVLLTVLAVESAGPRSQTYVYAQRDVARVSLAEAQLRAHVLEARAGLLRDDDPLNDDMAELRRTVLELQRQARVRLRDVGLLVAMKGVTDADEVALERFKTDNALLANAAAHFDMIDSNLLGGSGDASMSGDAGAAAPDIDGDVAALGNVILHLMSAPTPAAQTAVADRIDRLRVRIDRLPPGPARDVLDRLMVQGRLLAKLLPTVDADLSRLFDISTFDLRQAVRASQDRRRRAEGARAARFRWALYGATALLLHVLVRVAMERRVGLLLLRERAATEVLIAEVSSTIVAAPVWDTVFDEAVARLGRGFGADRAYLLLDDATPAVHRWAAPGIEWPDGWPAPLLAAVTSSGAENDEVIDLARVTGIADPSLRALLVDDGLRAVAAVAIRRGQRRIGVLGFDLLRQAPHWPTGGIGMVRLAGEVLQGALDRFAASTERRSLEERLDRARRLEALGTFASGIAHNFNNVVGAVMGHAEMAREVVAPGTVAEHHVHEIGRAAERAQQLVAAILDFGSRGGAEKQLVDVEALIGETASMLRVMAPGRAALRVELAAPGARVLGNAAQLQQVLLNLVRNSWAAMPDGGEVVVTLDRNRNRAERRLSHDALPAGERLRLVVRDDGAGMSERVLGRLFEPFFTGRAAGTGLGLATVREIVHDMDGRIDVRSRVGAGTTFTVFLPIAHADRVPDNIRRGSGETVLLLCAEPADLARDEDTVAALGYEPVGFTDQTVAFAAAMAAPDRFAALLLPAGEGRDGLATVREARAAGIEPPAILLTDAPLDVDVAVIAALGVLAVLPRPPRSAAMGEALSRCSAA